VRPLTLNSPAIALYRPAVEPLVASNYRSCANPWHPRKSYQTNNNYDQSNTGERTRQLTD